MGFLIVFIGGGIGAAMRHGFNILFARTLGTAFPYATSFENVSGSLVMGLLIAFFAFKGGIPQHCSCSSPPASSAATPPSRPFRWTPRCSTSGARSALPRPTCCCRWCCRSADCLPEWRWFAGFN